MHCLKCGTEIESPAVFCDDCLAVMKENPVSRETPLVLRPHPEYTPMPEPKHAPKVEDLLLKSQRRCKRLKNLCVLLAVTCVCLVLLLFLWRGSTSQKPSIGQNYLTELETGGGTNP